MAVFEMNGNGGGGGIELDLTNMTTPSSASFTAEIGKKYLVAYTNTSTPVGISSGATVDSSYTYMDYAGHPVYIAVVTATATTVTITGSGKYVNYLKIS